MRRDRLIDRHGNVLRKTKPVSNVIVKAPTPSASSFISTDEYAWAMPRSARVIHAIESLGIGGAQTMMFELVSGLNRYYGKSVSNTVVLLGKPAYERSFPESYGIVPVVMMPSQLRSYLTEQKADILIQHRISQSQPLGTALSPGSKYVLVNHTVNGHHNLQRFTNCNFYVSVCQSILKRRGYARNVGYGVQGVILNGIENGYLDDLPAKSLDGAFKSGRCHRLVPSKFRIESLKGLDALGIAGHRHYLIGKHPEAKRYCESSPICTYVGELFDRHEKMSYLKAFDVYYYETYNDEGASIAILEGLACGAPVICMDYGGCSELVRDGVNGYVVANPKAAQEKLKYLAEHPDELNRLRAQTKTDFDRRLHVRHTACKYMQVFENCMRA